MLLLLLCARNKLCLLRPLSLQIPRNACSSCRKRPTTRSVHKSACIFSAVHLPQAKDLLSWGSTIVSWMNWLPRRCPQVGAQQLADVRAELVAERGRVADAADRLQKELEGRVETVHAKASLTQPPSRRWRRRLHIAANSPCVESCTVRLLAPGGAGLCFSPVVSPSL